MWEGYKEHGSLRACSGWERPGPFHPCAPTRVASHGVFQCLPVLTSGLVALALRLNALEQLVSVLHARPEGLGEEIHGAELGSLWGRKMSQGRWKHNSCTNSLQNPE